MLTKEEKILLEAKVDEYCKERSERLVEAYNKAKKQAISENGDDDRNISFRRVSEIMFMYMYKHMPDSFTAEMRVTNLMESCKELCMAADKPFMFREESYRALRNEARAEFREEYLIKTGQKRPKHIKSKNEYTYTACYYKNIYR